MKKSKFFVIATVALVMLTGCLSMLSGLFEGEVDSTIVFDAASLRNVVRVSDDGIDKGWLAVSRDGQKLLYCEQPVDFDPATNSSSTSSRIMYLRNAAVFAKTPLVESYTYGPAFYENGTNFVYVLLNQDGNTQLVKSSVAGGGRTFVTRNPIGQWDNHPSVRDGIIACDTWISSQRQIVTLRDNGTEITILGPGSEPSWHPTENKLLFVKDAGIWEMDTETTQQTQLHAVSNQERSDGIWAGRASYTGDGKHIVFVKNVKVGSRLRRHLFAMDTEGNNVTELTSGNTDIWAPAAGAGNQIFFISNAGGGKTEIWSALVTLE
jgi:TolB protein